MSVEVYGGGGGASAKLQEKRVSPSTAEQSVLPDSGYDGLSKVMVGAMPSGALADPTVSASGVITSRVGTAGYLSAGAQKTKQLPTQAAKTVTPTESEQVAVAAGTYCTGDVKVAGVEKGQTTVEAINVSTSGGTVMIEFPSGPDSIFGIQNLTFGGGITWDLTTFRVSRQYGETGLSWYITSYSNDGTHVQALGWDAGGKKLSFSNLGHTVDAGDLAQILMTY
nr:MAG TPA: hypothetical protein [Caudoviricetes sp.]